MTRDQRDLFGEYIEDYKSEGFRGTKNAKGDFTYQELHQVVQEFFDEHYR